MQAVFWVDSRKALARYRKLRDRCPKILLKNGVKLQKNDVGTLLHLEITSISIDSVSFADRWWFGDFSTEVLFSNSLLRLPKVKSLSFKDRTCVRFLGDQ